MNAQVSNMNIAGISLQDAHSSQKQMAKNNSKKTKKDVIYNIGGVNFYDKKEILYTQYEKGNIAISANIVPNSPSQCFALFPSTMEVEKFVMAPEPQDRNFYEICLFSTGHKLRTISVKQSFFRFSTVFLMCC